MILIKLRMQMTAYMQDRSIEYGNGLCISYLLLLALDRLPLQAANNTGLQLLDELGLISLSMGNQSLCTSDPGDNRESLVKRLPHRGCAEI